MKVFVYGTLQRGMANNRLLAKATYLGEAITDSTFEMVDVGYPIMRPSKTPDARKVKGELFDLGNDTETLAALDRYEGVDRGLYERVNGYVMCNGWSRRAAYYVSHDEHHAPVVNPNKDNLLEWSKAMTVETCKVCGEYTANHDPECPVETPTDKPAWMFVHALMPYNIGYPGVVAELFFSSPDAFHELWGYPLEKGETLVEVTVPADFDHWDFIPNDY